MKINAKITKTFTEGSVKAIADITLDNAITIHGIKLIDGKNGNFVSMPYEKWQDKDGNIKHVDIVHPISADARSQIYHAVEDAFKTLSHTTVQTQTM